MSDIIHKPQHIYAMLVSIRFYTFNYENGKLYNTHRNKLLMLHGLGNKQQHKQQSFEW